MYLSRLDSILLLKAIQLVPDNWICYLPPLCLIGNKLLINIQVVFTLCGIKFIVIALSCHVHVHACRFTATMCCWWQFVPRLLSWRRASKGWSSCPLTLRRSSRASTMPKCLHCGVKLFPLSNLSGRGPEIWLFVLSSFLLGPQPPTLLYSSGCQGSHFQLDSSPQCSRQQQGRIMYALPSVVYN